MNIDRVSVRYGELRSTGYPAFSNERHEIELSAVLEPGDTADAVRAKLLGFAREAVAFEFKPEGEKLPSWIKQPAGESEMTEPF